MEGRKDERFGCLQDDQMLVFIYSKSTIALCLENVFNFTKWGGVSLALLRAVFGNGEQFDEKPLKDESKPVLGWLRQCNERKHSMFQNII